MGGTPCSASAWPACVQHRVARMCKWGHRGATGAGQVVHTRGARICPSCPQLVRGAGLAWLAPCPVDAIVQHAAWCMAAQHAGGAAGALAHRGWREHLRARLMRPRRHHLLRATQQRHWPRHAGPSTGQPAIGAGQSERGEAVGAPPCNTPPPPHLHWCLSGSAVRWSGCYACQPCILALALCARPRDARGCACGVPPSPATRCSQPTAPDQFKANAARPLRLGQAAAGAASVQAAGPPPVGLAGARSWQRLMSAHTGLLHNSRVA